jgi:hypothetical protein
MHRKPSANATLLHCLLACGKPCCSCALQDNTVLQLKSVHDIQLPRWGCVWALGLQRLRRASCDEQAQQLTVTCVADSSNSTCEGSCNSLSDALLCPDALVTMHMQASPSKTWYKQLAPCHLSHMQRQRLWTQQQPLH